MCDFIREYLGKKKITHKLNAKILHKEKHEEKEFTGYLPHRHAFTGQEECNRQINYKLKKKRRPIQTECRTTLSLCNVNVTPYDTLFCTDVLTRFHDTSYNGIYSIRQASWRQNDFIF